MTRDGYERLADIEQAIAEIQEYVGGALQAPVIVTPLVLHAVQFNLLVVGEATKSIDDALRVLEPDVPWKKYAGLRDVIAHQYFRVEANRIKDIVQGDLPTLQAAVKRLRARGSAPPPGH